MKLRGQHRLRVFEKEQTRIFGPKREKVVGSWRRLHNELHKLYSSPNVIRMRHVGHTARMGEMRN
jgi:hypothetical protein